jgi:hypothetical protein
VPEQRESQMQQNGEEEYTAYFPVNCNVIYSKLWKFGSVVRTPSKNDHAGNLRTRGSRMCGPRSTRWNPGTHPRECIPSRHRDAQEARARCPQPWALCPPKTALVGSGFMTGAKLFALQRGEKASDEIRQLPSLIILFVVPTSTAI